MNCYWPVEIPVKETNETKSFGFRGKIARQFKNAKHVNTVFEIQLFFSHGLLRGLESASRSLSQTSRHIAN